MIADYLEYTREISAPRIFRLWTAIHAVGAVGARRVWSRVAGGNIYPNVFVLLVGPPGVGKSMSLSPMSSFLRKAQAVKLAPNDMSKQAMLDVLSKSTDAFEHNREHHDFHFMAIIISELSNFMPQYDIGIAGALTQLWDCEDLNEESKRVSKASGAINFPGVSMICGTTEGNLGNTIGENMWRSGFMARIIMVHSTDKIVPKDMFADAHFDPKLAKQQVLGLARLREKPFVGPMMWDADARLAMQHFRETSEDTAPSHTRLEHYNTRRWMQLTKLAMIAALAQGRMTVVEADFNEARLWLFEAEAAMPAIFTGMVSSSDGAILEQLRMDMLHTHGKGGKPLSLGVLTAYLSQRVKVQYVSHFISAAESGGFLRRLAGTETYFANPIEPKI